MAEVNKDNKVRHNYSQSSSINNGRNGISIEKALKDSSEKYDLLRYNRALMASHEEQNAAHSAQQKRDTIQEWWHALQIAIRIFSRMLVIFGVIFFMLVAHWTHLFSAFSELLKQFFESIASVESLKIRLYEKSDGQKVLEKFVEIPFEIFVITFLLLFTPRIKRFANFFKKSEKASE